MGRLAAEWGQTNGEAERLTLIDTEADETADTTGARGTRDASFDALRAKERLALALS